MSIGFKRMSEVRVLDLVDVGAPCLASHTRGAGLSAADSCQLSLRPAPLFVPTKYYLRDEQKGRGIHSCLGLYKEVILGSLNFLLGQDL